MMINYSDWLNSTPIPYYSVAIGHDTFRECYKLPNNVHIYDHLVIPYSLLKSNYKYVVVDLNLKVSECLELVKKHNGEIDEEWGYTDDGYGLAIFYSKTEHDDTYMKNCFNFINEFVVK